MKQNYGWKTDPVWTRNAVVLKLYYIEIKNVTRPAINILERQPKQMKNYLQKLEVRLIREKVVETDRRLNRTITSSRDVFNYFRDLESADREKLIVLYLNGRNRIIAFEVASIGTLDAALVNPREIIKCALLVNAGSLILVHGHPSGDPTPSSEDYEITEALKKAAALFSIKLFDHIIIGDGKYISLADMGRI